MKIDTRWVKQIECCVYGSEDCVESKEFVKHFEECLDCGHSIMEVDLPEGHNGLNWKGEKITKKDLTRVGFNSLQVVNEGRQHYELPLLEDLKPSLARELWYQKLEEGVL